MKQIIGAYGSIMVFVLNIFLCVSMINVCMAISEAKEFKSFVVAEIEDSDFNPRVIEGCVTQAKALGYELVVTDCVYDEEQNLKMAEVVVTYSFHIPFLGMKDTKTTRGIAR